MASVSQLVKTGDLKKHSNDMEVDDRYFERSQFYMHMNNNYKTEMEDLVRIIFVVTVIQYTVLGSLRTV